MALATLSIDLVAQLAKFEGDMRRAAGLAENVAARMDRAFGGVGAVFAGSLLASAATQAVQSLSQLVPELINGVARFQDLEEKTGASAEALASFQTAADVAGTSVDQIAGFMVKLTGTLSKTNDETKGAGAALNFLGLELKTFRELAPEDQFKTLADSLAKVPDGASRVAVAIALLGKAGAESLPFLKELAQTGATQNRLTAEQIRLADDLADRNAKLRSELKQAAQVAALQALPAFNALTEQFLKTAESIVGLNVETGRLGTNNAVRDFAQTSAVFIGDLLDELKKVPEAFRSINATTKREFAGLEVVGRVLAGGFLTGTGREKFDAAVQRYKALGDAAAAAAAESEKLAKQPSIGDALRKQFDSANRVADNPDLASEQRRLSNRAAAGQSQGGGRRFFGAPDEKASREAEQLRKALADDALRALERNFASERDAVQFQQRFLELQQSQGLISLGEFYERRGELQARALDLQIKAYNDEAASLRQTLKAPDLGAAERVKVQGRVADVEAKAALARQQFAQQGKLNALEEQRAYEQAADRIIEFRAQVLELNGRLAEAAKLRADLAIAQAERSALGLGVKDSQIASYAAGTRALQAYVAAQRQVQDITLQLSIAEQRIALQAEVSGASRAETEQQLFAVRSQALVQMAEQLRLVEATAVGADENSPAVQFARQLRLEFEKLSVTLDPALVRLRKVGDEVADALGRAAGAISINFKDAKSAVASLGDALLRISTRELIEIPATDFFRLQLRGATEGGGAFADIAAKLFGVKGAGAAGSGQGGPGPAPAFSLDGLFGAGPTTPGFGSLFGSSPLTSAGEGSGLSASLFKDLGLGAAFGGTPTATVALDALAVAAQNAANALAGIGGPGGAGGAAGGLFNSLVGGKGSSGAFDFIGNSFIKLFGLADGGYTGAGDRNAPAGIVHKGEVVWSQADIARAGGVGIVEAMRLGARGYADGGVVAAPRVFRGGVQTSAPARDRAGAGAGGRSGDTTVNLGGVTVNSGGYMDTMAEDRAAQRIARKAERYIARRGA